MSLIALHQSTVNKMTLEELATSVRDPSTATKLKKAFILAEAPPLEQEKMERVLSTDLERVASSINNDSDGEEADSMHIQLLSNDSSLGDAQIQVSEGQIVGDAIQAAYPDLRMKRVMVSMGGEEIDMELTFSENGIEDGARLEVGGLPSSPSTTHTPFLFFWFFLVPFFLLMMRTALLALFLLRCVVFSYVLCSCL